MEIISKSGRKFLADLDRRFALDASPYENCQEFGSFEFRRAETKETLPWAVEEGERFTVGVKTRWSIQRPGLKSLFFSVQEMDVFYFGPFPSDSHRG